MPEIIPPYTKFIRTVRLKPETVFLNQPFQGKWYEYTWQETDNQVRRMASYLKNLGYEPGSKVAIISKNCAHWIMSDLAIMMAGYVSVPLYPTIPADIIAYVLEHSEAKAAFVGKLDNWEQQKSGLPTGIHTISFPFWTEKCDANWDEVIHQNEKLKEVTTRDGDDLMTIIYTSGTTGLPKGVMHSFHSLSYAATNGVNFLDDLGNNERFFSYLPLAHIAERMLVELGGIYSGGMISFAESIESFPENLRQVRPTIFLAVPRIWTKFQMGILEKLPQKKLNLLLSIPFVNTFIKKKIKAGLGLDRAKYLLAGAAPFAVTTIKWFETVGFDICEAYAMTENCAYSHITKPKFRKPGSVGQIFPNVQVRISEEGEIQTKSEANMLGYYKNPEKTAEVLLPDGFLCTGDQGEIDADGFLKITGRIKDIFKTDKGKYVAPAPIEVSLSKNTLIEQVCLVGLGLPQTMALIVLSENARTLSKSEVNQSLIETIKQVNTGLDKHEKIKKGIVMQEEWTVDNNLLTPTLKVKRNVLEDKFKSFYKSWYEDSENIVWVS